MNATCLFSLHFLYFRTIPLTRRLTEPDHFGANEMRDISLCTVGVPIDKRSFSLVMSALDSGSCAWRLASCIVPYHFDQCNFEFRILTDVFSCVRLMCISIRSYVTAYLGSISLLPFANQPVAVMRKLTV